MTRVWKYEIPHEDEFTLWIPHDAEFLSVKMQHGKPVLWVLVNELNPTTEYRFRHTGTGHPIKYDKSQLKFIDTYFYAEDGSLVFHLFEITV